MRVPEVRGPWFSLTPSRSKELPPADGTSVLAEYFHGQLFRQHVGSLLVGRDFLDGDLAGADVFAEVVVTDIDVLGSRSHLRAANELDCAAVILEDGAVHLCRCRRCHHASFGNLIDDSHERNRLA